MYLREWYLKTDPSFCRLSFIIAYCEKNDRAEQLRTLTAGAEQMQTYIQRGCNRHQLYIAKLHSFLCSWDQLRDTNPVLSCIQKDYSLIMTQIHPGKVPANIRDIDKENVRKMAMLLREE